MTEDVTEVCVYCKRRLDIRRALQRLGAPEGWRCRSWKACARRRESTRDGPR